MRLSRVSQALFVAGLMLVPSVAVHAATMTTSAAAPTVDGADISSLTGTADIGGNQGHVWSNRPRQGQTFTTGSNTAGYLLSAVSMRARVDQASTTSPNWEIRLGSVVAGTLNLLATENATGVTIPNGNPSDWLTWTLDTPLMLDANTVYAFDVYPSGSGFISMNDLTNPFAGGTAISSGSPGSGVYPDSPPNPLTVHAGGDRAFHVDLTAKTVVPEPATAGLALLGAAALASRRRRDADQKA